jgi:hypothetical protein
VPSSSVLLSGPGLLLAQTASAQRSCSGPPAGHTSSPWSTLPGRQPRRRSPVGVQHRGSSSRVRRFSRVVSSRPVSGHLGSSSGCPAVRSSAVHPSGVRPSGVHPSSVQPSAVRPCGVQPAGVRPVGPDASVSSHTGRWRWAQVAAAGTRHHGTGRVPVGCRAVERFGRRPSTPRRGRCCEVALVSGGWWRTRAGWVRRRVPAERAGRPGRRAEHRWLAA